MIVSCGPVKPISNNQREKEAGNQACIYFELKLYITYMQTGLKCGHLQWTINPSLISQSHVWEPSSSLVVSYYIIQLLTTTFIWDHFGTHEKSYMRFETKTQESTDRSFVNKSSWKFFLSRYYNTICSCNSSCTWSSLNARSCCSNLVPKLLLMFPLNPQWTAMSGAEFISSINMLMTEDLLWTFAQLTVYP